MPHELNIDAPIAVFGFGRSGTSLLFDIFLRHPDVFAVGETGPLVFGAWNALEDGLPNCRERARDEGGLLTVQERCVEAVRSLLIREFPSDHQYWMHKPIGLPDVVKWRCRSKDFRSTATWYWQAYNALFPRSKAVMALRDPFDTIASAARYMNAPIEEVAQDLAMMMNILDCAPPDVPIVLMDEMIRDGAAAVEKLFGYFGLRRHDGDLESFKYKHASYIGSYGKSIPENRVTPQDFKYEGARELTVNAVGPALVEEIESTVHKLFERNRLLEPR
jgi:hypothetical protein